METFQGITYPEKHALLKLQPRARKGSITSPIKKFSQKKLELLREFIEKLDTTEGI